MELQESSIFEKLILRDEFVFEQVFKEHFKNLHSYAYTMIRDSADAEEMVQQVFFKLWDRSGNLTLSGTIGSYLYRAVHNECLNFLKHQKVRARHQLHVAYSMKHEPTQQPLTNDPQMLEEKYTQALQELPEQCRTVFQLSRFENLKYREIADRLGISVKTVENHMGKALRLLRLKLIDFLPLLFLILDF